MRKLIILLGTIIACAGIFFWQRTEPQRLPNATIEGLEPDPQEGALVFFAAGCASCHAAPETTGDEKLVLSGGQRFPSPFGTFIAPNISPDPDHGIGGWSAEDLANAMLFGTSPEGAHYYPAFPYASYARLQNTPNGLQDIANLHAYLQTLPPSATPNAAHDVGFPFNIRRGLGLWKWLFVNDDWVTALPDDEDRPIARGRYLVETLGHCGECHTPRNALGGPQNTAWLQGAANPSGEGRTPAINALDWSGEDIAYYLETGFTPEYDSAGGHMAAVIENTAKLPAEDRAAIAAYLKGL